MEKDVLNVINLILRNLHKDLLDKIKKLSDEKMTIKKQESQYIEQKFEEKNYSFLDKKIFKRKEYQNYLKNQREYSLEYNKKLNEFKIQANVLEGNIIKAKNDVAKLAKLIDNPSLVSTDTLSNYFNSYQEIEEYCNSKNISIKNVDKLLLGKSDNDQIFMEQAINEDFRSIIFDNSYSLDLYQKVIDKMNEYLKNNKNKAAFETTYENNIHLFEDLTSGKYDGHFVKHVCDYIKFICARSKTDEELEKYLCSYYLGLSGELDDLYKKYKKDNFGVMLEKIYENDDYVIGCHGTSYKPDGDIVLDDKIFEDGIRAPIRGDTSLSMQYTVAYNIPFLEVLDYHQDRYGSVAGGYAYVLAIPKDVVMQKEPLWGIGSDGQAYIMPKYICGKYKQFEDDAELILNTNPKKKEYEEQKIDSSTK